MTNLNTFVENAIRTESKVDSIKVNEELLTQIITMLVNAGNILDQIKKHAFYNKPYDMHALIKHVANMNDSISTLNNINFDDVATDETELKVNPRIFHSIVGISTEATELLEALKLDGESIDNINIAEEFGDIDWYKAIGVDEMNVEWDVILETVINKLKVRYPNKFTSEDAIDRDLDKEREVLDGMKIT